MCRREIERDPGGFFIYYPAVFIDRTGTSMGILGDESHSLIYNASKMFLRNRWGETGHVLRDESEK
jgi:hypothetical protein